MLILGLHVVSPVKIYLDIYHKVGQYFVIFVNSLYSGTDVHSLRHEADYYGLTPLGTSL